VSLAVDDDLARTGVVGSDLDVVVDTVDAYAEALEAHGGRA